MFGLAGIEGTADPVQQGLAIFAADRNHVESTRPERVFRVTLKKSARRADDSPLLGPGDAVGAAAVAVVFAVPYFGENQRTAVQHDQVDFTETRLEVSLPRFQTTLV